MIRLSVTHARCLKLFWKYMLKGPWNTSWKKNLKIRWKTDRISVFFRPVRPCFNLWAKENTLNAFSSLRAFCRIKNFENRMENSQVTGETLLKRPFWAPSGGLIKKRRPKQHGHGISVPPSENSLSIAISVFAVSGHLIFSHFYLIFLGSGC